MWRSVLPENWIGEAWEAAQSASVCKRGIQGHRFASRTCRNTGPADEKKKNQRSSSSGSRRQLFSEEKVTMALLMLRPKLNSSHGQRTTRRTS